VVRFYDGCGGGRGPCVKVSLFDQNGRMGVYDGT